MTLQRLVHALRKSFLSRRHRIPDADLAWLARPRVNHALPNVAQVHSWFGLSQSTKFASQRLRDLFVGSAPNRAGRRPVF